MACTRKSIFIGHVAFYHLGGIDLVRQRRNALQQCLALIGKRNLCSRIGAGLGDAPGNRLVIGQAHDQPPLACHQFL
jgi:hypothetical protein